MRHHTFVPIAFALTLSLVPARAGDAAADLNAASESLHWTEAVDPVKIAGPIYFVGTEGLGVWLITTSKGHMLLNTGMPGSGPMIESSIRKLGFKTEDVKLLLVSHAHVDHVGALAYLKKATGAKVVVMDVEANLLRSGGITDFQYGKVRDFAFDRVIPDRTVRDGETVALGKVKLTAHLTPGHTRGATTWTTTIHDGMKKYEVVFADGAGVPSSYRLGKNPSYPGIADDYKRTFDVLGSLKPDIWLTSHLEVLDFAAKRERAVKDGAKAWVDPDGYAAWVAAAKDRFGAVLQAAE
ncbi:MAG TPA: subclass B3 metallo-beta-lactamase [Candidatus Polarisedimenticolaceae bacterium]|nr:subclass B3 metallo-beta-lactamase [Candidatus Polarisedimenticolaceae bacterium]